MQTKRDSHEIAVDILRDYLPNEYAEKAYGGWTKEQCDTSVTHIWISEGVRIAITDPDVETEQDQTDPGMFVISFFYRFHCRMTNRNNAVLIDAHFRTPTYGAIPGSDIAVANRLFFADALAAARAGALPGLEALYLAQAAQAREAAEYNERDRRARIELAVKERQKLGDILAHFGIFGITAESCAIGHWESEESATWCHAGAAISFGPGSGRIYVAVDEGDIENRWQDWMHLPNGEIEPCHKAELLSMIQRAAERAKTVAQAKQATPQPLQPLALRPFHLVEWFSGHDEQIQTWANEQRVIGYDDLKLIPSRDGVFATMHLVPDEE